MEKKSNEWYLEGLRHHRSEVLTDIFREFFPGIRTHICKNNGTETEAWDVFMDAIEVVYRKVRKDELVLTSAFHTFLFSICKNRWLNVLRQKKHDSGVTVEDPEVLKIMAGVSEAIEETDRFKLMREKFTQLPDSCRQLLDLVWHSNKSMDEIARELGFSSKYIRKRKHNCKSHLTELIKQDKRFQELRYA